jgi:tetratricopeptide (TPR) repeat protein
MLRIEDGRVALAMERAPLATGAVLDELVVGLPHVEFPFDFREGIERFRHHRGLAESASVSMEARLLLDWIHRLSGGTVTGRTTDDALVLTGQTEDGVRYTARARLLPDPAGPSPDEEPALLVSLYGVRVYGVIDEPWPNLAGRLLDLLPEALVVDRTLTAARIRIIRPLLVPLLASMGWKLPEWRTLEARGVEIRAGRVMARFESAAVARPEVVDLATMGDAHSQVRRAMERFVEDLELKRHHGQIDRLLAEGQAREALAEVYRALDGPPAPGFLAERLIGISASRPILYDEGERVCRALLEVSRDDHAALCGLVTIALGRGETEEATVHLERLVESLEGRSEREDATAADLTLAELLVASDPGEARAALARVLERSPDHEEALEILIQLAEAAGDTDATIPLYKRLLFSSRSAERTRAAGLRLAQHALSLHETEDAHVFLRVVLEAFPHDAEVQLALAEVHALNGRLGEASRVLVTALRAVAPADSPLLFRVVSRLATLAMDDLHEPGRARRALWRAVDAPDLLDAHALGLAELALRADDPDLVVRYASRVDRASESWPQAGVLLSRAYLARGDREEALSAALEVLETKPGDAHALELLEEAAAGVEVRERLLFRLRTAISDVDDGPIRARLHRSLARLYESLDLTSDAIAPYEIVLDADPNAPEAEEVAERLLTLYAGHGMWRQHQTLCQRLLGGMPEALDRVPLLLRFGRVALDELAAPGTARTALAEAAELAPRRVPVLQALWRALEALSDTDDLVPVLRRLETIHTDEGQRGAAAIRLAELLLDVVEAPGQARVILSRLPQRATSDPRVNPLRRRAGMPPVEAPDTAKIPSDGTAKGLYGRAVVLSDCSDTEAALRVLDTLLTRHPDYRPALELMSVLSAERADAAPEAPEAEEREAREGALPEAVERRLEDADTLGKDLEAARRLAGAGEDTEALRAIARVLELDSDCLEALEIRSAIERKHGEWEALADTLERLADQAFDAPKTLAYIRERALLLDERVGDAARAATTWARYLDWQPLDDEAFGHLTQWYEGQEAWEELASLHVRRAEAADEGAAEVEEPAHFRRAASRARLDEGRIRLNRLDDAEGAVAAARAGLMNHDDDPELLEILVRGLAQTNQREACREALDRLLPQLVEGPLKDEMALLRGTRTDTNSE